MPTDFEAFNAELREQGLGWTAGRTSVSDYSPARMRMRCGCLPDPDEPQTTFAEMAASRPASERRFFADASLPSRVDWRSRGGFSYVTAVKDQGDCGSCVAFAAAALLESRARVVAGAPESIQKTLPTLSEAQLFFCSGDYAEHSCSKGWRVSEALRFCTEVGVAPASYFKYKDKDMACKVKSGWESAVTRLAGYGQTTDVADMKRRLAEDGPLQTRFDVYDDFNKYKKGVYRKSSKAKYSGGHSVLCIGYDDSQQAWICKNSWGKDWGQKGYFMIGYGECGIDASMFYPTAFKSIWPLRLDCVVRDNFLDFGQGGVGGTLTQSPDIVPSGQSPMSQEELLGSWIAELGQPLVKGAVNHIYLRCRNLLPQGQAISLSLYWAPASLQLYPRQWRDNAIATGAGATSVALTATAQGQPLATDTSFLWTPGEIASGDHFCLITRASTDAHPNPIPDCDRIDDWSLFLADNPLIASRNMAMVDRDVPSLSQSMLFDLGSLSAKVYFTVTAVKGMAGASVALSCGSSLPQPQIDLPKTEVPADGFVAGVTAEIPAGFCDSLVFNYWRGEGESQEWEARISAYYIAEENGARAAGLAADKHAALLRVARDFDTETGPVKAVLVGDFTIKGK